MAMQHTPEAVLSHIVEAGHVLRLADGTELFVVPAHPGLLDDLAAFGSDAEDMEDEGVAIDWTRGAGVKVGGAWHFPVIVQDGEREEEPYRGIGRP